MWSVVQRDFSRLTSISEDLEFVDSTEYNYYPPDNVVEQLASSPELSIDIETSGSLDPAKGDIVVFGATDDIGKGYAIDPLAPGVHGCLSVPEIVGQNFILYDWWWLHYHDYTIPEHVQIWDTRFAGKLLNPDTPNDLTYLAGEFATPPVRGYWKSKQNYRDEIEKVCCVDVDVTLRVKRGQQDELEAKGQLGLMRDFIMPLSRVAFDMRKGGMKINKGRMEHASRVIKEDLLTQRSGLPEMPEWSPTQHGYRTENQHLRVQDYLYGPLQLPVQKKREDGKRTANQEALDELRSRLETGHESIRHLDEDGIARAIDFITRIDRLRDLSKLESAFLRYQLSPGDLVHPALNLGGSTRGKHEGGRGTAAFRFSCSDPNAQQVSGCKCKGPDGKRKKCYGENPECRGARDIFIPDHEDWEVMSVDLKQAEVVGFLWYVEAWDVLEQVLRYGMDAHQMVANKILGREATEEERDDFKTTTFAILYGEHERTTAARLHRDIQSIRDAREFYFSALPGVAEYRQRMISGAIYDLPERQAVLLTKLATCLFRTFRLWS
jgi:hypothetical protein